MKTGNDVDLEPRRSLSDVLAPPAGHRFDCGILTTYGLDALALVCVMGALVRSDLAEDDEVASDSTIQRRVRERIRAFTQVRSRLLVLHAEERMSAVGLTRHERIATLLDEVLRPVAMRGGSFHPKLWLLRYVSEAARHRYRLVCTSRNLTSSHCLELAVSIDLALKKGPRSFGKELGTFLRPALKAAGNAPGWVRDVLADVPRLEVAPDSFGDGVNVSLVAQRPDRRCARELQALFPAPVRTSKTRTRRPPVVATIVSPFVDATFVEAVRARVDALMIVSTPTALDKLAAALPADGPKPAFRVPNGTAPDLHAKVIHVEHDGRTTTLLGSANATSPAWGLGKHVNWECGVRWSPGLSRKQIGELTGSWTRKYAPSPVAPEAKRERDERLVDELQRELAGIVRAAFRQRDGASIDGALRVSCSKSVVPRPGIAVSFAPVLATRDERPRALEELERGFEIPCRMEDLTSLGTFQLDASALGLDQRSFVVTMKTDFPRGWRSARDRHVLTRVMASAGGLEGVLWSILTGGARPAAVAGAPGGSWGAGNDRGNSAHEGALGLVTLEQLMMAALDPDRAEMIESIMALAETSSELRAMWAAAKGSPQ